MRVRVRNRYNGEGQIATVLPQKIIERPQYGRVTKAKCPKVVVTVPAYNEGQYISGVVRKAKGFTDEIAVVDDGSTDNTARAARLAGASVESHKVNKGYGAAIKSCFAVARKESADILVILDGDGQHDPDDIPSLVAPLLNGEADVVIGSRYLNRKNSIPRYRKLGISVINFICNLGARVKISDTQSGFRTYNRKAIEALSISEKGMGASTEIIVKLRRKGLRIKEVPVSCKYHANGSSMNPLIHGLSVVLATVKLRCKGW